MSRKKTYNQADFRIKCDLLKPEMIAEKIFTTGMLSATQREY